MYEYDFVEIGIKLAFPASTTMNKDYQLIIRERAKDGWRFVQVVTPEFFNGAPTEYHLVFEREIKE